MELLLSLARPFCQAATAAERRMPRLGARRTRIREGLDELPAPAGFAPVSWQSIVMRRAFMAEAPALLLDGRLPCGMRINFATSVLSGL